MGRKNNVWTVLRFLEDGESEEKKETFLQRRLLGYEIGNDVYRLKLLSTCEPGHEKSCLMSYANNKGAEQPAHPRSLISAFVIRCLDSVMSLVSVSKISSLMLASTAEQAGLCLAWLETLEDTFCHIVAHVYQ